MKKIILLGLLITSITYAQTNNTKPQTQSKIRVYQPPTSSANSTSSQVDSYKWAVKTDIFSYVSGEFPIIGEYRIAKKFGIEASLGATYSLYSNHGLLDEYKGEGKTFETKPALGSAFRAGIKFYPSSDYDAIEGWAFGIQVFTRTNNRDYEPNNNNNYGNNYDNNNYDLSGSKDSRTKTGISITISKAVFYESNICLEYLIGIGLANIKHDFVTGSFYNESNSLKLNSITETAPNFQFGCRIGFGN